MISIWARGTVPFPVGRSQAPITVRTPEFDDHRRVRDGAHIREPGREDIADDVLAWTERLP